MAAPSTNGYSAGGISSAGSSFGAAASDVFAYFGTKYKEQGDLLEASSYDQASQLATENAQYTVESTSIKEAQQQRQLFMAQGQTTADVTGAGFQLSGSALDILRSNANQGALTTAVLGQQGQIQEASYNEQASAYANMADAARVAARADSLAGTGDLVAGGMSAAAGIASVAMMALV